MTSITTPGGQRLEQAELQRMVEKANKSAPSRRAWRLLLYKLSITKQLGELGDDNPSLPRGMNNILGALQAVTEFLHAHEAVQTDALAAPLLQLQTAILDLSQGRQPELLTVRDKPKNRPPVSVARANLMGIAARALDELVASGAPLDAAARRVVGVITAAKLPGRAGISAATLRGWRDRLRIGDGGGAPAAALARWNAPLPASVPGDPKARADFLLAQIKTGAALRWADSD